MRMNPIPTPVAFDSLHAAWRALKDAENAMPATSLEQEALLETATAQTDEAFAAMMADPTTSQAHLGLKLAAVHKSFDAFCFGLDREVGCKLFNDIIAALTRPQVQE
ncbi:hypothetical protein [Sphingomonas psychrolutea]|uniref:Uncharacterized protein n=1 Tax=Sphingomonas psychrolutea TaxID=1259676 RepID=A0ABQ1GJV6_9SPHN|nr:hypothetical protein [Sphingomonas psychrolutea]GGA45012.1 hypothetical protein GCM10011395_14090 [Sphingomonas psychrolutea]